MDLPISPLPTELVTLFGSSLLGGVMKLVALRGEAKRQERMLTLQALNARFAHVEKARAFRDKGFTWTRRVIALTATFFIIALPKLIPLWHPELAVHIGYPELDEGFLFFSGDSERISWVRLEGLAITPLDTHLLSAIIGLYFGGSLAAHNKG
ncbi:MAG: hypothetical protein ACFB21_04955 [Opitutales bacterium]